MSRPLFILHSVIDDPDKSLAKGYLFISANYRLLYPSTTQDLIDDVRTLFDLIAADGLRTHLPDGVNVDLERVIVVGVSGGNYLARAAATILSLPFRPKAWLSMYGMANDFTLDHWVQAKDIPLSESPFPIKIDKEQYERYMRCEDLEVVSDAPLQIAPALRGVSDVKNRVGIFVGSYIQGTLLDHIVNEPGLSATIRKLPKEQRLDAVPEEKRHLLLPLHKDTVPLVLIHGTADTIVSVEESYAGLAEAKAAGVEANMFAVEGAEHGLLDPKGPPGTRTEECLAIFDKALEEVWKYVA